MEILTWPKLVQFSHQFVGLFSVSSPSDLEYFAVVKLSKDEKARGHHRMMDEQGNQVGDVDHIRDVSRRTSVIQIAAYAAEMNKRIKRILLVDDHPVLRSGMRNFLDGKFEICGEAANGKEAIEQAMQCKPDLVLLDIQMPVMNGVEAAREIRRLLPKTKILMFSMVDGVQLERTVAEAGAHGGITKTATTDELLQTINRVLTTPSPNRAND